MSNQNLARVRSDVMKLMMTNHKVTLVADNMAEFHVTLKGPKDSPYEGGIWRVKVILPEKYPFKSPSIGFSNKIFHPNIDETSGSVCLDVINQTWSPMYELVNVFDIFLPQLLLYPNASDPLNGEAAALYSSSKEEYNGRIKEYVQKFASVDYLKKMRLITDEDLEEENDDDNDDDDRKRGRKKGKKANASDSDDVLELNNDSKNNNDGGDENEEENEEEEDDDEIKMIDSDDDDDNDEEDVEMDL
eukprot:m.9349 g.9349  ORF g.9349 m.9349 type:complete len:246 (+) comp3433_c0_seq2:117-854(+)